MTAAFRVGGRIHRGLHRGSLGVVHFFDDHLSLAFATFATLGAPFLTDGEQLAKTFLLLVTLVLVDFLFLLHRTPITGTSGIAIRSDPIAVVIVVIIVVIVVVVIVNGGRGRSGRLPWNHLGNGRWLKRRRYDCGPSLRRNHFWIAIG